MSITPFKVKALFEYKSPHDEDLSFPNSQVITVTEEEDADWYYGDYTDTSGSKKEGLFPRNFVEKFEPAPPPRPTRINRPKKEPEAPTQAPIAHEDDEENDEENLVVASPPAQIPNASSDIVPSPSSSQPQKGQTIEALPIQSPPAAPKPKPVAPVSSKPAPPVVTEKPASGSFRDRIAAFNKPAAPPVAPFKPGGLSTGGSGFIKKPFVAPPPSKDAYVPPPREQAQKVYRREEDPELNVPTEIDSSRAVPSSSASAPEDPDQPKPTSLKERIALLQKQQLEQAARHADAAQKKEKPKRPKQARGDSHDRADGGNEEDPRLEKINSADTIGADSTRPSKDEAETAPRSRRKSSRDNAVSSGILAHDIPSDANDADQSAAGETTEEAEDAPTGRDDELRGNQKASGAAPAPPPRAPAAPVEQADVGDEEDDEEEREDEEAEEEDDVDPEVRRRMEIRERMAKMSGGMGMAGMFGSPGGMPPMPAKKKKPAAESRSVSEHTEGPESAGALGQAPPIPIIPMASKPPSRAPQPPSAPENVEHDDGSDQIVTGARPEDEIPDVEDVVQEPVESTRAAPIAPRPIPQTRTTRDSALMSPSGERAVPPLPPTNPQPIQESPTLGNHPFDDEEDVDDTESNERISGIHDDPSRGIPPPIPTSAPSIPSRPGPSSSQARTDRKVSEAMDSAAPPISPASKRSSNIPPVPSSGPTGSSSQQSRAPPPPPPAAAPPSRRSTGDYKPMATSKHTVQDESEEEITEYEGDYDTDIASGAHHKDALKSHAREPSLDESSTTEEMLTRPRAAVPPVPPPNAPRAVPPPPPPGQAPKPTRQSTDTPRAPPPPPPTRELSQSGEDDDYDPFKYTAQPPPPIPTSNSRSTSYTVTKQEDEDDLYEASPQELRQPPLPSAPPPRPLQDRAVPPPPQAPPHMTAKGPRTAPRASLDAHSNFGVSRRSTEQGRSSIDGGIATDIDLSQPTLWWKTPPFLPPAFQNRRDLMSEAEESSSTQRGGKTTISKDVYVLFQDYSQTVINIRFDPHAPSDASLTQRHEAPPPRLRQDQLEAAHEKFGTALSAAASSKQNTVVGDGQPFALTTELFRNLPGALSPVGTRAFGALVYSNIANGSVTQTDEIRPGDVLTLRNAKFVGHRGPMRQKYNMEAGKPDHVGIVVDWDGTKKKVRAWEQGRESKKVKVESYKVDDLRSGELRVWRVVGRQWVGWEGGS